MTVRASVQAREGGFQLTRDFGEERERVHTLARTVTLAALTRLRPSCKVSSSA